MAIELPPDTQLRLRLAPVDSEGNPAVVEAGTVVWSIADATVGSIAENPDNELEAVVTRGVLGVTMVTVQADADLGAGVVTLTAQVEIAVVSGQAVSLGLSTVVEAVPPA